MRNLVSLAFDRVLVLLTDKRHELELLANYLIEHEVGLLIGFFSIAFLFLTGLILA